MICQIDGTIYEGYGCPACAKREICKCLYCQILSKETHIIVKTARIDKLIKYLHYYGYTYKLKEFIEMLENLKKGG